jgi:hypothetical protein
MNPVKHAVLDAVRSFLGMITACSNAFLIPIHGVKSPCSALWDRGKGLLGAWAPPSRCYTESHHRHYQELARLRHARAAVVDDHELRFDQYRSDTYIVDRITRTPATLEDHTKGKQYRLLLHVASPTSIQVEYWTTSIRHFHSRITDEA